MTTARTAPLVRPLYASNSVASVLAAVLIFATFVVFAGSAVAQEASAPATLTVTGKGIADAVPDMALVTSGVVTEAETVADALGANSTIMTNLMAVLQQAGIELRDIQTANFRIEPQYVYDRNNDGRDEPPRIVAYRVINDVTLRIRDIGQTGPLLDQMVGLGANQIRNIRFAIAETGPLREAARKAAVADARAKAETFAAAAGLALGRIVKMNEGSVRQNRPIAVAEARVASMAAPTTPIAGGEISTSAEVTIIYELEP